VVLFREKFYKADLFRENLEKVDFTPCDCFGHNLAYFYQNIDLLSDLGVVRRNPRTPLATGLPLASVCRAVPHQPSQGVKRAKLSRWFGRKGIIVD